MRRSSRHPVAVASAVKLFVTLPVALTVAQAFVIARPVRAQSSAEPVAAFRSSAPLTLAAGDALHRFTLPLEAYRDTRRDLGDLRVLNGAGEAVPFALAADARPPRAPAALTALRHFPVFAAPGGATPGDLDVSVRTRADGAVISVQPRTRPSATQRPAAWLLDASAVDAPVQALEVDWEDGPGSEVVQVSVSGSDDLRRWQSIVTHAALVRVEQGGQSLSQRRVEFGGRRVRYLRITSESPAFRLRGASAELVADAVPVRRELRQVVAVAGEAPGEYAFDLGARLPVEAVRVLLPSPNTVAPITLLSRDSGGDEWRHVSSATVYRLTREGTEVSSPSIDVGHRADRYWLVRVDERSGGIGAAPPSLEVAWRPAHVVFVARGEPPFRVVFGNPDVPRAALSLANVIPDYRADAEHRLPVAEVGGVTTVALRGDGLRQLFGEDRGRRLALWTVLLLGVVILGYMAAKLARQMALPPDSR